MNKKLVIAILGIGTVGYGVYDIIKTNPYFKDVEVKYVLGRDKSKQSLVDCKFTTSFDDIVNDNEVNVVIECMGGLEFAYNCIKKSLLNKKHVITANKEVIATYIKELTNIKKENNVSLYYEASVGGGIPIIKNIFNASIVNNIRSIKGILNGTTNFIITKMTKENKTFREALREAQEKGFAEADPTADLEGLDMVRKIAILSSIAYKQEISPNDVYHYGISTLNENDIKFAKSIGAKIKLIASSKYDKTIELRIEPVLVKDGEMLSSVDYEFNVVEVDCDINGKLMFYGKGAGRYPTANSIIYDLMMIMQEDQNYSFKEEEKKQIKTIKEKNRYYIRVNDVSKVNNNIIEIIENNHIITKEIYFNEIEEMKNNLYFYARLEMELWK